MNEKKLYALTDDVVRYIKQGLQVLASGFWANGDVANAAHVRSTLDALTPATVDDLGNDAIERMARGLSEHWRDMHTNEALGQQRMLARAALDALLDRAKEEQRNR